MRAVALLPPDHELQGSIDLSTNKSIMIGLSVASILLFFLFGWLFQLIATAMNPTFSRLETFTLTLPLIVGLLVLLVLSSIVVVVLHEAVHGLFFWLFTRDRPTFGFKGVYAYAAAPNWYIPRSQYILVGLAPFVLLTLLGIALFPFVSLFVGFTLILALALNASGAVGDLYVVALLLGKPSTAFIQDYGDGMRMYRQGKTSVSTA